MHEVLLAGWGGPIGELFWLEELATYCEEQKRWTFFVTSEPCNVCHDSHLQDTVLTIQNRSPEV
jgi:hypothetical protein